MSLLPPAPEAPLSAITDLALGVALWLVLPL